MTSRNQLSVARHIWARQLDQATEICLVDLERRGSRSRLGPTLMLCHWWRGDRESAYELALKFRNSKNSWAARPAIEVAASYTAFASHDQAGSELSHESITMLARVNGPSGIALALRCPGWFIRSVDLDRGHPILQRVTGALENFVAARHEHSVWAGGWLAATPDERRLLNPPPI